MARTCCEGNRCDICKERWGDTTMSVELHEPHPQVYITGSFANGARLDRFGLTLNEARWLRGAITSALSKA